MTISDIKFSKLTILGKLLLLPTIGVVATSAYYGTTFVKERMPNDLGSPVLLMPVSVIAGVLFFLLSATLLEVCGARVIKATVRRTGPSWLVTGTEVGTGREVVRELHAVDEDEARTMAEMDGIVISALTRK